MAPTPQFSFLLHFVPLLLLLIVSPLTSQQPDPNAPLGPLCAAKRTTYPCPSYAFYRASPGYLDLASIGDLFNATRLSVARASNISDPATALYSGQPVLVPLSCSCYSNHSYSPVRYKIKKGDSFWLVSTTHFANLTQYQDVILLNPTLVPTNLDIGVEPLFPVFCQCPNRTLPGGAKFLLTYLVQPGDTPASIASGFGAIEQDLTDLNNGAFEPWSNIFVPLTRIPVSLAAFERQNTTPPGASPAPSSSPTPIVRPREGKDWVRIGLGIAVCVLGSLLSAVLVFLFCWRRSRKDGEVEGGKLGVSNKFGTGRLSETETSLMSDIYECLDKYRVFQIDELRRATSNFDSRCLIEGSVYKGWLSGQTYAIKRMKWNAMDELRILQKVNHTNLVKLEGFCIDPEDSTCYLVYEYVENGSLHSWLHDSTKSKKLNWRTRLRIAADLANGLQYMHEHAWPKVVHKDIKSSNVLLDEKLQAKIANFGLARSGCNAMTTNIVGTQGYVAPEYLADGIVTTKMDVFAYGVVLLELVSGREAVSEAGESLWADMDRVFEGGEIKAGEKLVAWLDSAVAEQDCPLDSVATVMGIARDCLKKDPSKRPSMVDVVYTLSKADDTNSDFSGDDLPAVVGDLSVR